MTKSISRPLQSGQKRHRTAQIALTVVAAIWGATFFMIKDATATFPIMGFLALRFCLITVIMLPLAASARRFPTRTEWGWGLLAGLMLMFGYIGQTFSMRLIDSGRAGFITGLYVVIVPFLALFLLRIKLTRRILIGTACALAGLTLLGNAPGGALAGDALALMCAAAFALQILIVGQFPKSSDWRIMTVLQLVCVAVGSLILLPTLAAVQGCEGSLCSAIQPFADALPTALPAHVLFTALFTGILASGVGFSAQIWAQRVLPVSEAALIYAMESPFAALFGVLFRGEVLTSLGLVGGSLIVMGVIVTSIGGDRPPEIRPESPSAGPQVAEIPAGK